MKTSFFEFTLPQSLIATHPAHPRDSARMLVVDGALQDCLVRELPQFLKPGDVMVFNDTRVIPARLFGLRGAAKIEILLHKRLLSGEQRRSVDLSVLNTSHCVEQQVNAGGNNIWQCFAKPAKKLRVGDRVEFSNDFAAAVLEKLPSGEVMLAFAESADIFHEKLERYGHMPLPPYVERPDDQTDSETYQTIYAKHEGSVAAPTAGLHFTPSLLDAIDAAGVKRVHVTLHVGGGTFLPVKADDTSEHLMHSEYRTISPETVEAIRAAKANGGRVIAVGTTSLRTLESAVDKEGKLQPSKGETSIFITPGYQFKVVDILLTNFHLPRSTLFMLVSAFSGLEAMQAAYAHAISHHYRFYSYGDACLLYRTAEAVAT